MAKIDNTGEVPAALALRKRLLEQSGLHPDQVRERLLGEVAEALARPRPSAEVPVPPQPSRSTHEQSPRAAAGAAAKTRPAASEPAAQRSRPVAEVRPILAPPGRVDASGFGNAAALDGPMMDDAARLYSVLNPPMTLGIGLTIQFISASPQEGTSTLARAFAVIATTRADGRVLLFDMDWSRNSQYGFFSDPARQAVYGAPGGPIDLAVDPALVVRSAAGASALPVTFHPIGNSNLVVSRYNGPGLPSLSNHPPFWQDLRRSVSMCVIDSQPTSRSMDGIVLCGGMDAVVIVVEAENTRIPVVETLRDKMLSHGANVVGLVFNKRKFYIPKRIYQWL